MKLTNERISKCLQRQKKINDILLKIVSKNRNDLILLSEARSTLLRGEQKLRDLLEQLVGA
jgi:hypothetical protein